MTFNNEIMMLDIKRKRHREGKSRNTVLKEIGICKFTLKSIEQGNGIRIDTFCKCVDWIGKETNRYFKK